MCTSSSLENLQSLAEDAVRQGRYSEAIHQFQLMMEHEDADHSLIHSSIAFVYSRLGNSPMYESHILKSCKYTSSSDVVYTNYAVYLYSKHRVDEARKALLFAIDLNPVSVLALANLSILEADLGNLETASTLQSTAISIDNQHQQLLSASLHLCSLLAEKNIDLALSSFLAKHQDSPLDILFSIISDWLQSVGRHEEALGYLRQAFQINPCSTDIQLRLASLLLHAGRAGEAIELLLYSLSNSPGNLSTLASLGDAYYEIGEIQSALHLYEEVYAADQLNTIIANRIGCCCRLLRMNFKAINVFENALLVHPGNHDVAINLASSYQVAGRSVHAIACLEHILHDDPLNEAAFYQLMFLFSTLGKRYISDSLALASRYWSHVKKMRIASENSCHDKDHGRVSQVGSNQVSAARPIHIAILSPEIGNHVVSRFMLSLLQNYDKNKFKFSIILPNRRYEPEEEEIIGLVHQVVPTFGLDKRKVQDMLKSLAFDILIETSGYTADTSIGLLDERIAPVQCHYIGYHASTGMDGIDYFIGDSDFIPPDLDSDFSEKIIRLPRTWLAMSRDNSLPHAQSSLTIDKLVFGCFNQSAKYTEDTYDYWAAALHAVPDSILLIKDYSLVEEDMNSLILGSLESRDVNRERLRLVGPQVSWADHMSLYNAVDVSLDCTPWSGSTTVFDSLSMGTPYMAIVGNCSAARMSGSIVRGYGRPDWLASSLDEYSNLAKKLAGERAQLRANKYQMQQEVLASKLFDGQDLTRSLEEIFMAITRS